MEARTQFESVMDCDQWVTDINECAIWTSFGPHARFHACLDLDPGGTRTCAVKAALRIPFAGRRKAAPYVADGPALWPMRSLGAADRGPNAFV